MFYNIFCRVRTRQIDFLITFAVKNADSFIGFSKTQSLRFVLGSNQDIK